MPFSAASQLKGGPVASAMAAALVALSALGASAGTGFTAGSTTRCARRTRFEECTKGAKLVIRQLPLTYVHREHLQYWYCYGMSCMPMGTKDTPWLPGYAAAGGNE